MQPHHYVTLQSLRSKYLLVNRSGFISLYWIECNNAYAWSTEPHMGQLLIVVPNKWLFCQLGYKARDLKLSMCLLWKYLQD